jgi:hypothetical protein
VTAGRAAEVELDHRRARRLGPAETVVWYGLAGVSYVGLSIFHKFLLNWLIGPLWLAAFVWLGPRAGRPGTAPACGPVRRDLVVRGDHLERQVPRRRGYYSSLGLVMDLFWLAVVLVS